MMDVETKLALKYVAADRAGALFASRRIANQIRNLMSGPGPSAHDDRLPIDYNSVEIKVIATIDGEQIEPA